MRRQKDIENRRYTTEIEDIEARAYILDIEIMNKF